MKKTLLKINNMKRFCKWLDQTGVHLEIIRTLTTHPWMMSSPQVKLKDNYYEWSKQYAM